MLGIKISLYGQNDLKFFSNAWHGKKDELVTPTWCLPYWNDRMTALEVTILKRDWHPDGFFFQVPLIFALRNFFSGIGSFKDGGSIKWIDRTPWNFLTSQELSKVNLRSCKNPKSLDHALSMHKCTTAHTWDYNTAQSNHDKIECISPNTLEHDMAQPITWAWSWYSLCNHNGNKTMACNQFETLVV